MEQLKVLLKPPTAFPGAMPASRTNAAAPDVLDFSAHAYADIMAPRARHDPRLGHALLLQLLGGDSISVEGVVGDLRGEMHILLVSPEWTVDAPRLVRHAARVDPTRTLLYEGEGVDNATRRIRQSEGWRFRRRYRGGEVSERVLVDGGVAPAALDWIEHNEEQAHWLRAVLSGLEHSPEDPRWGMGVSSVRGSILAFTRNVCITKRPRSLAFALDDPACAYGLLKNFDLVLPVRPLKPQAPAPRADDPAGGPDELASEHLRSWLSLRKQPPMPVVPHEVVEHLQRGLTQLAARWKKHQGQKARRIYGARVEQSLMRLCSANARAEARASASKADARVALQLVGWSWSTIAHLKSNV